MRSARESVSKVRRARADFAGWPLLLMGFAALVALLAGAVTSGVLFAGESQGEGKNGLKGEPQGLFTEEQSEFGRVTFLQNCAGCHSMDMVVIFRDYRTAQEWFGFVESSMPWENEGGLTDAQYISLVAFFLHENGFLPGDEELVAERDLLTSINPRDPSTGLR